MATLSQNIAQAISDFNSIKTAIENKDVTVPSGTPTSRYAGLIGNIPDSSSMLKSVIEGTLSSSITIPDGITAIRNYLFHQAQAITGVTMPASLTRVGDMAFYQCRALTMVSLNEGLTSIGSSAFKECNITNLTLPSTVTSIGGMAFSENRNLTNIYIPHGVTSIGFNAFSYCSSATTLFIPNTITSFHTNGTFEGCTNLVNVTLENGFNGIGLKLNNDVSTRFSAETIVGWLNALADRTRQQAYTLTIGSTNLAKLTAEQIAIATNKNWNLA